TAFATSDARSPSAAGASTCPRRADRTRARDSSATACRSRAAPRRAAAGAAPLRAAVAWLASAWQPASARRVGEARLDRDDAPLRYRSLRSQQRLRRYQEAFGMV